MQVFASLFISTTLLISTSVQSHNYGKIRVPSSGKVSHNGDYAVYDLNFTSSCYMQESDSISRVSSHVLAMVNWLDRKASSFDNGHLEYTVGLIHSYSDENRYLDSGVYPVYPGEPITERDENPCYRTHSTYQNVSIKLTRAADVHMLDSNTIQEFYNEIYAFLWPLNLTENTETHAYASAKVTNVNKGVFEGTLESMREAAYAKATQNATRSFLSILGADYHGTWFLNGADFTNYQVFANSSAHMDEAMILPAPVHGGAPDPIPTIIKLDPLSYSVDGTYEFSYSYDFNERSFQ